MKKELSHILNHHGEIRSKYFHAVSPPIIQSSNFMFNSVDQLRNMFDDELSGRIYTRGNNPTVEILRKKMAALENCEDCLIFGSGIAAISSAILSQVASGDHIVSIRSVYSWTDRLLVHYLPRFQVTYTFVDGKNHHEIENAIRPNTKILYLESPTTMLFELQDLEACVAIARKYNLTTIIDNSCASSLFQKPADYGIDLIAHSGTKYLNGHSDVVIGVLCGKKSLIRNIFESEYMNLGGICSPHDAALMIRGLRTYPLRMKKSMESAQKIVEYLIRHQKVQQVNYPFHPTHPQYELATRQMTGLGGLFSIRLNVKSIKEVEKFVESLQSFLIAVSWGGHESLIFPACSGYRHESDNLPLPWDMVRLYIGLEDPDILMRDLERAFQRIPE